MIRLALSAGAVVVHTAVVLTILTEPVLVATPTSRAPLLKLFFHDVNHSPGPGADFFALYHAGVNARRGESIFAATEHPQRTPYYFEYRYLPVLAQTLGRAATALPPRTAWLTWLLVTEVSLVACLLALRRLASRREDECFITVTLLLSTPYWLELYMGQFTFVAAALTVVGVACVVMQRTGGAAVSAAFLTAASLLKVYPVIVLPAIVRVRRGWWIAAAAVVVLVATNAVPFLSDPLSLDRFWLKNFVGEASGLDAGNHGLLYALFVACDVPRDPAALVNWGRLTLLWRVFILAGTLAVVVTRSRIDVAVGAATLLIAHFLSYFQVWEHHYSAVVPAGLLLLITTHRERRWPRLVIASAVVAIALPTPFALQNARLSNPTQLMQLAGPLSKALPLLTLYCAGIYLLVTRADPCEPRR
jgi:hypothetical protein